MQHFGYLLCRMTVAEVMNKSDHDLFCKLCAPTHALNHLLPPARNRASLRTRGHSYQLPEYSTDLHKKSFLICSLYSFVKWNRFFWFCCFVLYWPSVLWRCWLGGRKGIRPVKNWAVGVGVVIYLERGADLHMFQLMPLPLTVSCFSKIEIGFTFLVPAHLGGPGKRAVKWGVCALYCTSFWLCFLCLLFDVRLSHLINITYIHTYIYSLAKICRDARTAEAWTPVIDAPEIDARTAVQRIRHAPWTTSVIERAPAVPAFAVRV